MKYCIKCGNPLEKGAKFCTSCGNKVEEEKEMKVTTTNKETDEDSKKATRLGIISICMYFGGPIISYIASLLVSIFMGAVSYSANEAGVLGAAVFSIIISIISLGVRIASWVLMIIMRVKYPNNTFGKILMWVYIGILALRIILAVLVILVIFTLIAPYM